MADVVGTAYVRIKALTDGIQKDIKSSMEKGVTGAKLDKTLKSEGEDLGEEFGGSIADSTSKTLKKRSKDLVPGDDLLSSFDDTIKGVEKRFEQLSFDDVFDGIQNGLDDIDLDLPALDLDADPVHDALAAVRRDSKDTADEINKGPLKKSLDDLEKKLKSLGNTSLPSVGRLGTKLGLLGGAIIGALPYIQDVGSAILSYATGLVAEVGFLSTALVGLGVAAGAAIGSAATAILPVFLAFKAETNTLVEFKDSMAAAGEEFLRIGVATQQTLLPALDEAVFVLGDLVPMFSEFGLFVGRSVGDYAKFAANVLVGNEAQGRFRAILQSSLRILDVLLPTILNVGNILSGVWVAALPAAERFVDAIGNLVQRWSDMITVGLETGTLTEKFDLWYDRAALLGSALGDLAGALGDILEAGATASGDVFVRFDEWATRFREFTSSEVGQNKLALIFENALAVMREINGIAADLFDGILGRLTEVGGVDSMVEALQRFRDVIPEIQDAWSKAYDVIKEVVGNLQDRIAFAWDKLSEPLGRLATQVQDLFETMSETGAFEIFVRLMATLTDILSTLLAIPGFGQFVAYFLAFNSALKVANIVLGPFINLFGRFSGLILTLGRVSAGQQVAGLAGGIQKLAAGFRAASAAGNGATLAYNMGVGASNARGFAGAIGGAASAVATSGPLAIGLGVAAVGVAAVGTAFFLHQRNIQRWRQEVRQATDALGLLNGGLNTTAEGISKYVTEFSRFESKDQLDDLIRIGIAADELGKRFINGSLSIEKFIDAALRTNEIEVAVDFTGVENGVEKTVSSLDDIQKAYSLTDDQLQRLVDTQQTFADDGTRITLDGNTSLIKSYKELQRAIGDAAKDNIDSFVTNAQNIRLLGGRALEDIKNQIDDASAEDAGRIMIRVNQDLAAAAKAHSAEIKGLSDATRVQIHEQATLADGTVDLVKEEQLLTDALSKQNAQILANIELFTSEDAIAKFGVVRDAAIEFVNAISNSDLSGLSTDIGLDELSAQFPQVVTAADELFRTFEFLPDEEFRAFAETIGLDADKLKSAMEGAKQAIADLQSQALESLPSIGKLLDEATTVDPSGKEIFSGDKFTESVQDRIDETRNFKDNFVAVLKNLGPEAAQIALQQGPEAAKNLSEIVGTDADTLKETLAQMEAAEQELSDQIERSLGPVIRAQYATQAGLIGDAWGGGIAGGLNSDETLLALRDASMATINELAEGFQGHFVIEGGELKFVHTGTFRRAARIARRRPTGGSSNFGRADGGLIEGMRNSVNGALGTDTVNTWLTPGEFVMTRGTVDRLGPGFFEALNAGGTPAVPVSGGGISANGWTIVSPDPEESARQIISRFRSASFLLGGG